MANRRFDGLWLYVLAVVIAAALGAELIRLGVPWSSSIPFASHYMLRGVEFIALYAIYFGWLFRALAGQGNANSLADHFTDQRATQSSGGFIRLLGLGAVFLLIAFAACPTNTSDIYLYLHYGIMSVHGVNPYAVSAEKFATLVPSRLLWFHTSAYGPISMLVFSIAATFARFGIPLAIYVLKTEALGMHVLNTYLLWRGVRRSSIITFAYLINPTVLLEHVVNGRTEVYLSCFVIVMLTSLLNGRDQWAGLAILAGVFTKTLPIVWIPLFVVYLASRRRWGTIGLFFAITVAIVTALTMTLFHGRSEWVSLLNPGVKYMTMGSLHYLLKIAIKRLGGILPSLIVRKQAGIVQLSKLGTYAAFCLGYAALLWRLYFRSRQTPGQVIRYMRWSILALFLFATPWLQPWYATVLLPFMAMDLEDRLFLLAAMTFTVTGSASYYLLAYSVDWLPQTCVAILTTLPTIAVILLGAFRPHFADALLRAIPRSRAAPNASTAVPA